MIYLNAFGKSFQIYDFYKTQRKHLLEGVPSDPGSF